MTEPTDITAPVAGFLSCVIIAGVIWMIYAAVQPYQPPKNPWDNCELIASVMTQEKRNCGKACSMPVYAHTYQCPGKQKTWLDARWSLK